MDLAQVMGPAIRLAEEGYLPAPYHSVTCLRYATAIQESDYFRFIILRNGTSFPEPNLPVCRPDLSRALRRIAANGVEEFYTGSIAKEIDRDMTSRGGFITRKDLALLRVYELEPLRTTYRGYEILTSPWPTIGGALIQGLNMLETFQQSTLRDHSVDRLQLLADTFNIALEDDRRNSPSSTLPFHPRGQRHLNKHFAEQRAELIQLGKSVTDEQISPVQRSRSVEEDTTQVSIVDRWGNAVSLTQTLGRFYGCKVATPGLGFPYNSHLEGLQNLTPRALIEVALAPTIVLEQGEPVLVLGSAGSARVPGAITNVISYYVDGRMGIADAVSGPRLTWWREKWEGELWIGPIVETIAPVSRKDLRQLSARGYSGVERVQLPDVMAAFADMGAVNAVHLDRETRLLTGVSDPRRAGVAGGADF
jgi:gamma-glutamyltranspeptidase/glutathione hydrolase